jgi:hypothetical protein
MTWRKLSLFLAPGFGPVVANKMLLSENEEERSGGRGNFGRNANHRKKKAAALNFRASLQSLILPDSGNLQPESKAVNSDAASWEALPFRQNRKQQDVSMLNVLCRSKPSTTVLLFILS